MPTTKRDLIRWEKAQDVDKFAQIIRLLDDDQHQPMRRAAVRALRRIHTADVLLPLVEALAERDTVSPLAKAALDDWGTELIEPMYTLAVDRSQPRWMRAAAANVINQFDHPKVYDAFLSHMEAGGNLAKNVIDWLAERESSEPFINFSKDLETPQRYLALQAVSGCWKHPQAWDTTVAALKDEDVQIRWEAVLTLYKLLSAWLTKKKWSNLLSKDHVLAELVTTSHDEDYSVRGLVAVCLQGIPGREAEAALVQMSGDEDVRAAGSAIHSLSKRKGRAIFGILKSIYLDTSADHSLREDALEGLTRSSDKRAGPFLLERLNQEGDESLLIVVIFGVGHQRSEGGAQALLPFLLHENRKLVLQTLKSIEDFDDPECIPFLLERFLLEEETIHLKWYWAIFTRLKARQALPAMIRKLNEIMDFNIEKLTSQLEKILEPDGLPNYLEFLKKEADPRLLENLQALQQHLETRGDYKDFQLQLL
jgi:HEAT repeat protein